MNKLEMTNTTRQRMIIALEHTLAALKADEAAFLESFIDGPQPDWQLDQLDCSFVAFDGVECELVDDDNQARSIVSNRIREELDSDWVDETISNATWGLFIPLESVVQVEVTEEQKQNGADYDWTPVLTDCWETRRNALVEPLTL